MLNPAVIRRDFPLYTDRDAEHPLIYLDNAATTRVAPEVAQVVADCMREDFGNPSSAHRYGIAAERRVKQGRTRLLAAIGDPDGAAGDLAGVVFTQQGERVPDARVEILDAPIPPAASSSPRSRAMTSGCSSRNRAAASRPWPMDSPSRAYQAPRFSMRFASTARSTTSPAR